MEHESSLWMSVVMVPLSFTRKAVSVMDSTEEAGVVSGTPLPPLHCITQNTKQKKNLTNLHCLILPSLWQSDNEKW